jgi:hypothetical protein
MENPGPNILPANGYQISYKGVKRQLSGFNNGYANHSSCRRNLWAIYKV